MKRIFLAAAALMLTACASDMTAPSNNMTAPRQPTFATNVTSNNWKVYNLKAATYAWDISKAQSDGSGGVQFPVQQYVSKSSGSFAIYLEANYNVDITDKTITAAVNWTPGTYVTRSTVFPGAYVRIEFQDVASGGYTSNDYWWYSGNILDLNSLSSGTLTAPLTDRANWTNICGKPATDTNTYAGPNCVGTTDPAVSPSDGFTNAMKNIKQINLAFGSAGSYASGVALQGGTGTFHLTNLTITP